MLSRGELTENPNFAIDADLLFKNKIEKYNRITNGGVKVKETIYSRFGNVWSLQIGYGCR